MIWQALENEGKVLLDSVTCGGRVTLVELNLTHHSDLVGRGVYSFVAWLGRLAMDHAPLLQTQHRSYT